MTPKPMLLAVLAATMAATTVPAQESRPKPLPPAADKAAPTRDVKPDSALHQPAQLANVRVDVKIVDERGGQPVISKTLSLTVGDRQNGSIRSSAEAPLGAKAENFRSIPLNVDASPVIEGGRIRLQLGIEYHSVDTSAEVKQYPKLELKQRLGLVLEDGKNVRVAQSADPLSDRHVSLEVTATILR